MNKPGLVAQMVSAETADMVDYFAKQFQVTSAQAIEVMVAMASAALEARDQRAQYFAHMMCDKIHKEIDASLLVAARNGSVR